MAAMGFPVSCIVVNIYMEYFVDKALRTAQNPPRLWKRFVDNTYAVQYTKHKENIIQHINNIDSAIKLQQKTQGQMVLCHSWTH